MTVKTGFSGTVEQRQNRQAHDLDSLPRQGAFYALVTAPAGDEKVQVSSFVGDTIVGFSYPFASARAWIRGQPETGTVMLSILGSEGKDIKPVNYFDPAKAGQAKTWNQVASDIRTRPNSQVPTIVPYRSLSPGDVDMGSGFAQQFLGLRDVYQARGGLSHLLMTSQKTELATPSFTVQGPHHATSAKLNDETRFGVVRRATATSNPTLPALIRGATPSPADPLTFPFAKEHTVELDWKGYPGKLLSHRQGIVVEDDGTMARSAVTQKMLRARFKWFSPTSSTEAEIDESGNWSFLSSLEAQTGGSVSIPAGNLQVKVGLTQVYRSNGNAELSSSNGRLDMSAFAGFRLGTPSIGDIEASQGLNLKAVGPVRVNSTLPAGIQLGELAKYPILLGNPVYLTTLTSYLGLEASGWGLTAAYGTAAAAAWAAVGPLLGLLDPTGTVSTLCLTAGAAATAMAAGATAASTAIATHMPTLTPQPAGFMSTKVISE